MTISGISYWSVKTAMKRNTGVGAESPVERSSRARRWMGVNFKRHSLVGRRDAPRRANDAAEDDDEETVEDVEWTVREETGEETGGEIRDGG